MGRDTFIIFLLLALAVVGIVAWWYFSRPAESVLFETRELSSKVVYILRDGTVTDLKTDCSERAGEFNACGSQCEPGVPCALVCVYTCEFGSQDQAIDDDTDIACGVTGMGDVIQCPEGETCFTFDRSSPTCSDNPCSVCAQDEECLQLESYPVQIHCSSPTDDTVSEPDDSPEEPVVEEPDEPSETPSTPSQSDNIRVATPTSNELVTSPITISGEARVFEGTVNIRVTNKDGLVLIEEFATAHAPDVGQFGPFSIKIFYDFDTTNEGFVEVFNYSARDGSKENLVKIPVTFN